MIPSPARDEAQRWITPITPFRIGTATIARPSPVTLRMLSSGIARSIRSRINSGGTSEMSVIRTMVTNTTTIRPK